VTQDSTVPNRLGDRLRSLRAERGLTQTELASRAGLSRAYLAALERGLSSATKRPPNPTRGTLSAIARALGVTVESLRAPRAAPEPSSAPIHAPWQPPEADAVEVVTADVSELGLVTGDQVFVRNDPAAEGVCLLRQGLTARWSQIARIGDRPFELAPDGSYRPLGNGVRVVGRAIALVRAL